MIDKVSIASVKNNNTPKRDNNTQKNPAFKGGLADLPILLVQQCEKQPMVNVSVLDLSTAIVPRTVIETKESNGYAGFEAFRRESSGLVVNCLIPGFIVAGVAKLLQKPIMKGFGKSDLSTTWANENAINKIHDFYAPHFADKSLNQRQKVYNTFRDELGSLSGVDGSETKHFADIFGIKTGTDGKFVGKIGNDKLDRAVNELVDDVLAEKHTSKKVKEAYRSIVEETHIAENIKFKSDKGFFSNNLESLCDDTVKMLRGVIKEDIKDANSLSQYFKKATKLVNWKSIGGLGVIIPLAISMQPINRWITHKTSGQKGAPIYKDFGKDSEHKEMTTKEKAELLAQKFISIGSMVGVCGLSMFMDRPILKNIFQFKGIFPTMDQARIISTATFASRMGASEDRNELREATVRDIATFSSFYFLGDYVAKGIATFLEKKNPGTHLINKLKDAKEGANPMQKLWNWAKHTSLKSSDELATIKDKRLRTICQLGNIVFSLLSLGVFIPLYTRSKTNKKRAEELAKLNADKNSTAGSNAESGSKTSSSSGSTKTSSSTSTTTTLGSDDFSKAIIKDNTAFKSFINS